MNYFIHDERDLSPAYVKSCRKFLKEIVKKVNKENAPPDGWRPEDKASSSQAGGPAHKESGSKRLKKVAKIYEDQKILEEHFKKV